MDAAVNYRQALLAPGLGQVFSDKSSPHIQTVAQTDRNLM